MKYYNISLAIIISCIFLSHNCAAQSQTIKPISAKVEAHNGTPTIMLNGIAQNPMIYALTDVPGGRWSWEELPRHTLQTFCSQGFNLLQVDLFFDHVWKEDGSINLDTARMQLRGVLNVCPQAAIFIRFHVTPPKWWMRKHAEENTVYADVKPTPDITWGMQRLIEEDAGAPTRTSLASALWLKEAGEKLQQFLQRLQKLPEANAIAGIQVAGGVYGEWHYWGFINNEPDMAPPMQAYFKNWLKEKYVTDAALQTGWHDARVTLATATLPSMEERDTTQAGIFRDPQKERKVIDYYEAQHTCVADDILFFCKLIKNNWPRPIITGAFYGYFYATFGREAAGGHLALMRVLQSPYIDYLSGPGTYYPDARDMGEPYRSRSLINSVALHGKLWLDEMDQQPPLANFNDTAYNTSLAKSIANVRRNVLYTFTKGMGLWFYDFGPAGFNGGGRLTDHGIAGWWDDANLMQDIGRLKKLLDKKTNDHYTSGADVLLVHDTKTSYYSGSAKTFSYMAHWANNWVPVAIFKSGVVQDVIHIDDLDKVNLNQYKAIVFINTWVLNDVQVKLIQQKAAAGNRHLIFLYAPGYGNEERMSDGFIQRITGISVTQVAQQKPSAITVNNNILPNYNFSVWNNAVNPMFVVTDNKAEALGRLKDSAATAFAKKSFGNYTSWFIALPPANPALWRYIFKQAGANIYDEEGDIFYSGRGILSVHTAKGGARNIRLANGKNISLTLPANSTTLVDSNSGEVVLQ